MEPTIWKTKAPNSYIKLNERIAFKVDAQSYAVADEVGYSEKVPNKQKGTLPATGGEGVTLYIGFGCRFIDDSRCLLDKRYKA